MDKIRRMNARTVIGFAIAPLVIPIVIVTCYVLLPFLSTIGSQVLTFSERLRRGLGVGIIALGVGYFVTLAGATPAHLWFVRRGWRRWWMYVALGTFLGIAPWLIYGWVILLNTFPHWHYPIKTLAVVMGLGVACGVSAGLLFWLVAVRISTFQLR